MTGPSEIMVDLAEKFVSMITHADWAIFAKNGTDVTTMAMMTARASTKRRKILVARKAYHGAAPWCNPYMAGILPEERAHIVYYEYNDSQSLEDAFRTAGDDAAGVFASAFRHDAFEDQYHPTREYAVTARRLCDQTGALLIIDDVRAGFRLARDCSWSKVEIQPDLSAWGNASPTGIRLRHCWAQRRRALEHRTFSSPARIGFRLSRWPPLSRR
jgi:glutamate-1-semialdehyde 2,1-aminomutase